MKLLLTGFEPFYKSPTNPSEMIVRALANESLPRLIIETAILPVDLERGPATLLQAVETTQPNAVLCLGQASRRAVISIERVAINLLDFRIPDNAGIQVSDQPIVVDGPAAYFTTLPARAILDALKAQGIPAQLSLSAGAYLCNQVIYGLLHQLKIRGLNVPAGFIHLPNLPEQAASQDYPGPSMSLETMTQAVRIAIQVIAQE